MSSLESPFQEQFTQDPYLLYSELRQREPVYRTITPDGLRVWVVTCFEDVRSALANQGLSKNLILARNLFERNTLPGFACRNVNGAVAQHMLESDPPNHTRLRKLVENSFTAGRISALRPRMEQLSSGLLSSLAGESEIDLVNQYGFPLAFTVICEILGLPEGDRDQFRLWINDYSSTGSPEQVSTASDAIANYLTELLAAKRIQPSQDVLGRL
ncbi:cytochrome P450, partial [Candidatus Frankia alpina]